MSKLLNRLLQTGLPAVLLLWLVGAATSVPPCPGSQPSRLDLSEPPPSVEALVMPTRGLTCLKRRPLAEQKTSKIRLLEADGWTSLRNGDELILEFGSMNRLLCPDGTCRLLESDQMPSLVIGTETCRSLDSRPCGPPLGPSSDPIEAGRRLEWLEALESWAVRGGSWMLRGRARDPDQRWGQKPIPISPRCLETGRRPFACEAWTNDPSFLIFAEVKAATSYRFVLTGSNSFPPLEIAAQNLDCRRFPDFEDHRVCRLPWPSAWRLPRIGSVHLYSSAIVGLESSALRTATLLRRAEIDDSKEIRSPFEPGSSERWLWERLRLVKPGDEEGTRISNVNEDLWQELWSGAGVSPEAILLMAEIQVSLGLPEPAYRLLSSLFRSPSGESQSLSRYQRRRAEIAMAIIAEMTGNSE